MGVHCVVFILAKENREILKIFNSPIKCRKKGGWLWIKKNKQKTQNWMVWIATDIRLVVKIQTSY